MHVLVVGASGRTGRLVVEEALERGHKVTALVRNPRSMESKQRLYIVQGTPMSANDINQAMSGSSIDPVDAVIVTLNAPRETDSPFAKPMVEPRFMADAVTNISNSMKSFQFKRIVVMSAFGVGDSFANLNFMMKPILRHTNMSYQFDDHELVDKELRESALDWVLVRHAMLKDTPRSTVKDLGDQGQRASFMPSISRASVAVFLLDAAEKPDWLRRSPVIAN